MSLSIRLMNKDVQIDVHTQGHKLVVNDSGRVLLPVSAYNKDALHVEESILNKYSARTEIAKGAGKREYFLLLGKLITHDVQVLSNYPYVGRMLTEQGDPLNADVVLSKPSLISNSDGNFTLETNQRMKAVYVLKNHNIYQCPLEVKMTRDVVNYVDDITCKDIDFVDLPSPAREMATSLLFKYKMSSDMVMN